MGIDFMEGVKREDLILPSELRYRLEELQRIRVTDAEVREKEVLTHIKGIVRVIGKFKKAGYKVDLKFEGRKPAFNSHTSFNISHKQQMTKNITVTVGGMPEFIQQEIVKAFSKKGLLKPRNRQSHKPRPGKSSFLRRLLPRRRK